MGKLAVVATIKTVAGKRDEYVKRLKAHSQRYLATEPGTLKFEIILPHDQADTVMLYETRIEPHGRASPTRATRPSAGGCQG
jgi:autoinducer 2-degrading protein